MGKTAPLKVWVESAVTPDHKVQAWALRAVKFSAVMSASSVALGTGNSEAGKAIGSGLIDCA
jgi:hypothetical protein